MSTVIFRRQPTPTSVARLAALAKLPLSPVLARVYAQRKIDSAREINHELSNLPAPSLLKGVDRAVDLLQRALVGKQRILIVADFDADGATSCALATRALRLLGAAPGQICFKVPNRFEYGYGLTPEIVKVAAAEQPDLLLTVDNGISSVDGVAKARQLGLPVLITDHHLPGQVLPEAAAIVNPNQPGCPFPSKNLAGVGVIFYLMLALRARLREHGWFSQQAIPEPNLARLLDLVAFGTVADVVPLDHVNRILVAQGLRRIRAGQCCAGISALIDVAGRPRERLTAGDIGFVLGPRINAAGRLEDMSYGIHCLLSDDPQRAQLMARELDRLNRERRVIEAEMRSQAQDDLARLAPAQGEPGGGDAVLPFGLCLYDPRWHQGIIGILAARLREQTHRPAIAFAPEQADNDSVLKGSARSVPGLHIRDALDAVAARQPGLISKFGGHAMAAGLSLPRANLGAFSDAFDQEVRRHLSADDLRGVLYSDGELNGSELSLETAEALRQGGPWGQGFPEPLFDGEFEAVSQRIVGNGHLKLVVKPPRDGRPLDAIAFNHAHTVNSRRLRLAYRLDINEWQGKRSPQLVVEYLEAL